MRATTGLALLGLLTMAGCARDLTGDKAALSCRADDPTLAAAEPKAGSFEAFALRDVNPRGVYTLRGPRDTKAVAATQVKLSDLGLKPGDYVGLQVEGQFRPNDTLPPTQRLGAIFLQGSTKVAAGVFGAERSYFTPPTLFENIVTDISQDFDVPASPGVVVRVPKGATALAFSVGDSFYGDNAPAGSFGVTITRPNQRTTTLASGPAAPAEPDIREAGLRFPAVADLPTATHVSTSQVTSAASSETKSQWRGHYPSGWAPAGSKYKGPRSGGTHWGWDIFAPKGSKLIAPVWPAQLTYKQSASYGLMAIFAFKWKNKPYQIIYAHLDQQIGADRTINGPDEVGIAGCSGNAGGQGCGSPLVSGGRTEHVHVGFFRYADTVTDQSACNPDFILNWKPL
jgi:hypothetical protein